MGIKDWQRVPMKRQSGFSMLEVMIALVILMFGLLGIGRLQLLAVNNTEVGRYHGLATMLASSMAAAMKANLTYWKTPPNNITVNKTTITGGPPTYGGTCINVACTSAQMAYFDLSQWGTALSGTLPVGTATIACNNSVAPAVCTITVNWMEKNVALGNPTGAEKGQFASGTVGTNSFQTLATMQ